MFNEMQTLKSWIEDGVRTGKPYVQMEFYWSKRDDLIFELGLGVGFIIGGIMAIAALLIF